MLDTLAMYRTVLLVRTFIHVALVISFLISGVLGTIAVAAPEPVLLVVCSPGSPGSTQEAQPRMDQFARVLSTKAGTAITAAYDNTDAGCVKRMSSAGLAIVSLPFFLAHEKDLGLHARLVTVQEGRPALESWTLVAPKGRIHGPEQLAGFTIASSAAFAPAFVRGAVQAGFGPLPNDVKLQQTTAVVSALRRAANGEPVAVLLDGTQAAALGSLPFAAKLDVVTRSPAWPMAVVVTVDARLPANAWAPLQAALLGLNSDRTAAPALTAIKIAKFVPLDEKSLASARQAYGRAP